MQYKEVQLKNIKIETAPLNTLQQESLTLRGQREPVRLWAGPNGSYTIVDGRRRVADMRALGKEFIWALVYDTAELDEENLHLDALTLNSGQENYMDEADHIMYLIDLGYTPEDISQAVNASVSTVRNRMALYKKLIPAYKEMLRSGKLKISAAFELLKVSAKEQEYLFNKGIFSVKKIRNNVKLIREKRLDIDLEAASTETAPKKRIEKLPHTVAATPKVSTDAAGLYISPAKMEELTCVGSLSIEYQGVNYVITCEEGF